MVLQDNVVDKRIALIDFGHNLVTSILSGYTSLGPLELVLYLVCGTPHYGTQLPGQGVPRLWQLGQCMAVYGTAGRKVSPLLDVPDCGSPVDGTWRPGGE